jgi:hypothetical protein
VDSKKECILILLWFHHFDVKYQIGINVISKYYHVGILEGVICWPLASCMKAQWKNYCFQIIKLLDPLSSQLMAVVWSASSPCPKLHKNTILTPKGRTGPTGAKPDLGNVVWTHTIFRILEFFFPNASRNKLRVSTNLMILGATDQKLWVLKFWGEVWAGRACAGANHP